MHAHDNVWSTPFRGVSDPEPVGVAHLRIVVLHIIAI
jgi:hypothetical protein